ncbi:MAG TPA: acetate--CoA ligase family protein [Candidatus Brocadiia bacterium]|nr:acetate--CoA ligase family protein [Candidatus Brocadiales bacterium]
MKDPQGEKAKRLKGKKAERLKGTSLPLNLFTSSPLVAAKALLKAYGIPTPESVLTHTIKDAVKAAKSIGFPIVLKIVSSEIIHKSDVGGVKVGIKDVESLKTSYNKLLDNVKANVPKAKITGVLVEKMAHPSIEVIIGALRDPQFGPAVMFGLGGIFVEAIKDVSFRLAPVNEKEALEMIKEIKAYPLLNGFRGSPRLDVYTTAKTLLTVSRIISEIEQIKEIDLNPVLVYPEGIMVVDARVILG